MRKLSEDSWFGLGMIKTSSRKKKKKNATDINSNKEETIGVLAFEVASLMSKAIQLWQSLGEDQIVKLKDEAFQLLGVRKLISDDDDFLLTLAFSEFMDSIRFLACSISRLGNRCADPLLHRFDRIFADMLNNGVDLYGFQYVRKKMERKVKKMERLVGATSRLYQELEVLAELEQTLRRMQVQANSDPNRKGNLCEFKHKVVWQRQEVKCLRDTSLWNRTYGYAVRLLARTLFNIVARIKHVFGLHHSAAFVVLDGEAGGKRLSRCHSTAGMINSSVYPSEFESGGLTRCLSSRVPSAAVADTLKVGAQHLSPDISPPPPLPPSQKHCKGKKNKRAVSRRSFNGCIAATSDSPVSHRCLPPLDASSFRRMESAPVPRTNINGVDEVRFPGNVVSCKNQLYSSLLEIQHKPLKPRPSTLGDAALALHYANVIIMIEKLAVSPHLIGHDARDGLYNMLPASIRVALRARLKSYAKNLTKSYYDPVLALEWSEAITRMLEWLAPLAHNMIRCHSERNFEQQHLVSSTNILLLQTLYFANQVKTEAAITELLVGLNYLWRFGRELDAKAKVELVSSGNLTSV